MKVMKLALLGTAALAAVSVSARADQLSDLKAQIEALNARVATLESTPAVPAGYSMVSISKGDQLVIPGYTNSKDDKNFGPGAHVIAIMPTADAPAPTTEITWSGYVRAAVVAGGTNLKYTTGDSYSKNDFVDVRTRAELKVAAKTDTAVGEVGAKINFKMVDLDGGPATNIGQSYAKTDGFWGWWKMTPNLTLGGGLDGSLAKNSYTYDAQCFHCMYTDYFGGISNNANGDDPAQLRLSYADGPLGIAVALEDSNNGYYSNGSLGVAAKATYSGDTFGIDLSGGYWGHADGSYSTYAPFYTTTSYNYQDAWAANIGAGLTLGAFQIGAAVGMGSGFHYYDDYTKASGYIKATLNDQIHADVGLAHVWWTDADGYGSVFDYTEFDAGIYYEPVKQLSLGLEGMYRTGGAPWIYTGNTYYNANEDQYRLAFVSIFSF
jgi:hypothetical protein